MALSLCINSMDATGSCIDTLSVNSSSSHSGATPVCASTRSTNTSMRWRANCDAARLIAIGTRRRPHACQRCSVWQACCKTHSPMAWIRLLSSATG